MIVEKFVSINKKELLDDIKCFTLIPSPTFHEKEKVEYVANRFREIGLLDVHIDKKGNAIGILNSSSRNTLLVSAHADTVFSKETKLAISEKNGFIYCPSIADNSTGLAAMLKAAEFFAHNNCLKSKVVFAANVCEEGLGNLGGIKHIIDTLKPDVHLCVEGHNIGRFTHITVGSVRLKIKVETTGGHSWRDFPSPNAIEAMAKIITQISKFELPKDKEKRTTYNFGTINGGTSVNAIASSAEMLVDLRSISSEWLQRLKKGILEIVGKSCTDTIKVSAEIVGERPGGSLEADHWLVSAVKDVHAKLGIESDIEPGSTDSNYPISIGIPSITIGITKAFNTHSEKEYMAKGDLGKGLIQLIELIIEVDNRLKKQ